MKKKFFFRGILLNSIVFAAIALQSCSKSEQLESTDSLLSPGSKNASTTLANTGEVTLSGSTWTAKVDGSTKYTGNNLMDAANAAINAMTSGGTVHIRASGNSGPSGGAVKSINLRSNVTIDFHGYTFTCNSGDDLIIPVKARNASSVGVTNLNIAGNPRYGILLQSCNGMQISNITQNTPNGGLGIRVDHGGSAGNPRNLTISGNINIQTGNQCIETYALDGFTIGNVTVGNSANGCGVLLNQSKNGTIGTITATNCNYNGSYAGFRVANTNGPNVRVTRVNATSCARGVTSTSNSNGLTIDYVDARNNRQMGVNIYSSQNVLIKGGYIWNNGGGGVEISTDGNQSRNNTIENVNTNDGLREWSGSDYNVFRNCRLNGSGLTLSGANSSAPGTY
jgi:hypothetical protein